MEFDVTAGIAVLERNPAALRAMLSGLGPEWLDGDEGPGTWTPRQNISHLILGEKTDWIPRARIILEQNGDRRFTPFDMSGHIAYAKGKSIDALLDEFATLRAENIKVLRGWKLSDAQMVLTGVHPEFGDVTMSQLLATWVAHDLGHVAQIARVMAKQYKGAIGPWRTYLPVVDRQ